MGRSTELTDDVGESDRLQALHLALDAPELREQYEQAITFGLGALQAFDTLDALQAHYYDDRHRYGSQFPECPEEGTVEAWAQAARLAVSGGDELLPQAIAEAAFWRRACQIDPTLPSLNLWPDDGPRAEGGQAA